MGTPYFILATGQSNIIGRNAMSWSPNARAKIWNNQPQNDTDVGTAYGALSGSLMGIGPRYAHNIAAADVNKDVYYAEYSRGGMGIECWVGGAMFSLQYGSVGAGKIYVNSNTPATITAMEVNARDLLGVLRRGTGSNLNVNEFVWLKQGANYGKYQINSWSDNPTGSSTPTSVTVYCTPVAYSGTFTEGAAIQVEFQPRFLTMIENSVPAALAAAGKSTVDILLWWQGETDSYPSVNANYATEFNFIMSYLGAKPWWSASTKVIICGINSTANNGLATSDQMNSVLAGLVSGHPEREFCGTASTLASNRWQDRWHMTAQGYSEAGDLLINAIYAPPLVGGGTATYAVSPSTSSVVEGSSVTFTVATTNVGSTTLYWTNAGTTTAGDFTDSQNSGSFAVTSNSGSFVRTLVNDGISDSGETVVIQIRTGSTSGTVVATASTVSVTDSGGGGTGSITGMSVGSPTTVMDFRTNGAHGFIGGGTIAFGLWNDGPAIPYRDAANNVYIGVPHSENYRFKIPDWSNGATWTLEGPTFMSARDVVEGHYNNRYWIFGGWSEGNSVYHLAHHEWYQTTTTVDGYGGINNYHVFNNRWVNGIGLLTSSNGGASFAVSPDVSSNRLVLVPEPWAVQSRDPLYGFFHPSNIVKEGSYYYACVEQRSLNPAVGSFHDGGVSLIRTTNVTSAVGWEFWNGTSWESVDHNFYQGNNSYQKPHRFFEQLNRNYYVAPNNYNSHMGQALRYHTPSGQWLMFGFSGTSGTCLSYSVSATLASPTFSTIVGISSPDASVYDSSAARFISVFDESATDKNFLNIGNNCTVISTNGADGRGASFSYCEYRRASLTITVDGASPTPSYNVTPSTTTVTEGAGVTFTVATTNVGSTTLYWTNAGTTTGADFTDSQNSGSFAVSSNSGSFVRTLVNDGVVEGAESIVIQIRTGSTAGPVVATATTVSVTDTGGAPTYTITPSTTDITEGQSVSYTITTTNFGSGTLYWTNSGTTTAPDFSDGANSGTIAIVNNSGTLTRTLTSDGVAESTETIIIQLRTGSTGGTVVATAATVNVASPTITYNITPYATTINEGQSVTYSVTTTNFGNGTLYWTTSGTVTSADFSDGLVSGSVSVTNNAGTITRTLVADAAVEGSETMTLSLRTDSTAGTVVATAPTVTVVDATTITYNITPSVTTMNEGQSVTFTVTTTNFGNGTLFWAMTGTTVGADFSDGLTNGSITITNDSGSVTRTLNNDLTTEGTETFALQLLTGSVTGTVVASSATVTVNDSSKSPSSAVCWIRNLANGSWINAMLAAGMRFRNLVNNTWLNKTGTLTGVGVRDMGNTKWITFGTPPPVPTYTITPSVTTVNEGAAVTYTITTTNFGSGTLYWTNGGSSVDADFTDGLNSGSITITNNGGVLTRTLTSDGVTESTETIILQLRTGSTSGTIVATASTVNIVDASVPTYSISPSVSSVNEGQSVTYTITTTNFGSGTLYWTNSGSTVGTDFSDGLNSGGVSITNNSGTLTLTLASDGITESTETIIIQLRTGSTAGTVVATAATVSVVNVATPTYSITPSVTTVNEGQSVTYTITTTNFGNGTLYWTTTGSVTAADFSDGITSGSVTITNNSGSVTRTLSADLTTEGNETMFILLRTGSTSGTVVATADGVNVIDTSTSPATLASPLVLTRNDLDFIYSSVVSGAEPTYMEVIMTVDCTNFFNYSTNPISHLVFALDPRGDSSVYYSNGTRDHCGQIVRRGQALFDGARGFIIDRTGKLAAEHWYDGAGFGLADQGFGFNPLVYKVFTVRIRGGYRNGPYGNRMEIDVFNGTTINGTLLTGASLAWGWDWPGYTRMAFGAIGGGFVSPNDTSCVETSNAGPAAGATVVTSNFSLNLHY